MEIKIRADKKVRVWPRVEAYQNTTLRYTPDARFPKIMESILGRQAIIRLFVTLDEVWDYRDDTYSWDYLIGVNRYVKDKQHADYDWPLTVPSPLNVHEMTYLTSHAACADEVMLNIRRYEREVFDGVITIEKYEKVFEHVVEYYKSIIPNIVYIECCNEVEIPRFGGLEISQYYELYKSAYRCIQRLNQRNMYDKPLKIGGFGMSAGMDNWHLWECFLELLSQDEHSYIDFYSIHDYHMNPCRILEFYIRHEKKCGELNLPKLPILMSEYGMRNGIGDAGRPTNLQNASGEVSGFILGSYCENLHMFPWCSFHNPDQQLGRTMFILNEENMYVPTPSGHVMSMFHRMERDEVLLEGYCENQVAAAKGEDKITILSSNPKEECREYDFHLYGLSKGDYNITEYFVDETHNNCLYDKTMKTLLKTSSWVVKNTSCLNWKKMMTATSICFYEIDFLN